MLFLILKFRNFVDFFIKICYTIYTVRDDKKPYEYRGQARKENQMEEMTNEQFNTFLKMIVQIIEDSDTKEEAVEKIKKLTK